MVRNKEVLRALQTALPQEGVLTHVPDGLFEGFLDDPITHSGPDSGYLKGLDTLIRIIFRNLEEDIDLRKANA